MLAPAPEEHNFAGELDNLDLPADKRFSMSNVLIERLFTDGIIEPAHLATMATMTNRQLQAIINGDRITQAIRDELITIEQLKDIHQSTLHDIATVENDFTQQVRDGHLDMQTFMAVALKLSPERRVNQNLIISLALGDVSIEDLNTLDVPHLRIITGYDCLVAIHDEETTVEALAALSIEDLTEAISTHTFPEPPHGIAP